ncbi:MAG: (2Fe-2S) ferredoxin domain-containing protein [Clostridia bacterium]|nr:(2Fe-2S) ferredoxin domain-containing protein [Clostridia bacterium]
MIIQICIGSSCHLKGSYELVEKFKAAIEAHDLDAEITLAGSFCTSKCNREGVTVLIDDNVYTGVTPESFKEFFREKVLAKI